MLLNFSHFKGCSLICMIYLRSVWRQRNRGRQLPRVIQPTSLKRGWIVLCDCLGLPFFEIAEGRWDEPHFTKWNPRSSCLPFLLLDMFLSEALKGKKGGYRISWQEPCRTMLLFLYIGKNQLQWYCTIYKEFSIISRIKMQSIYPHIAEDPGSAVINTLYNQISVLGDML